MYKNLLNVMILLLVSISTTSYAETKIGVVKLVTNKSECVAICQLFSPCGLLLVCWIISGFDLHMQML